MFLNNYISINTNIFPHERYIVNKNGSFIYNALTSSGFDDRLNVLYSQTKVTSSKPMQAVNTQDRETFVPFRALI